MGDKDAQHPSGEQQVDDNCKVWHRTSAPLTTKVGLRRLSRAAEIVSPLPIPSADAWSDEEYSPPACPLLVKSYSGYLSSALPPRPVIALPPPPPKMPSACDDTPANPDWAPTLSAGRQLSESSASADASTNGVCMSPPAGSKNIHSSDVVSRALSVDDCLDRPSTLSLANAAMTVRQAAIDDSSFLRLPSVDVPPQLNGAVSTESLQQYVMQAEVRLAQSMSTPCPSHKERAGRTESTNEYRRLRSEGSTAGSVSAPAPEMDYPANVEEIPMSPMHDSIGPSGPYTKHSQTEQVLMMHTLKTKLSKYQAFIDKAFQLIAQGSDEAIIEGCTIVAKVMTKAWVFPKISHDLAYALCDFLREQSYLEELLSLFIKAQTCESIRLACGRVLEECMSLNNRDFIVNKGYLKKLVATAEKFSKNPEHQRMSISIMESLFKHSSSTSYRLIEYGVLDYILLTCKRATDTPTTLRHAALALANLSLYSCAEGKKKIIQKKVPDWLFLLASQPDDITRYYACLAICMLGSIKEIEAAVIKSGTLSLVEPFLLAHQPESFAGADYKHSQGRPKEWLLRLMPMLHSKCREAKSMAAFHFTMEAAIKKDQQKLEVFQNIGAIDALKEVASSPDEVAAKFASEALTIIGEEVPYKLSQQVPCWSVEDVQYWVKKIGFEAFADKFAKHMVDGDLLLLVTEKELESDIEMKSGLLRKRFMRELESLKIAADYSSVDETQLDQFLMSLSPELSVYSYQMLGMGLNRTLLPSLTDEMMKTVCGMSNPIHRLKLRQALQDSKHIDDIEVAILSKQIDVFISYRRSTGNQLASLIKVLLQLRGYKVFIDVDKLYAGKFDASLLKNIQAAKHFILVLTPNSLDRLLGDTACDDWVHKELRCAFDHQKNVIPIFDQHFEFPASDVEIPSDIRHITRYNGVRWVHEYQEACIDKVERFIKGELNRTPSIGHQNMPPRNKISNAHRWPGAAAPPAPVSHRSTNTASKFAVSRQLERDSGSIEKQRKKHHESVSSVFSTT